ncbi:MAG: PepSY domain-containing protein [Paracoccus sp. (in: a-proteobacteria)]
MRRHIQIATALLLAGTSLAQAETNEERITRELTEQGFSHIEITREDGQMKVEALRGSRELEITYDLSTGEVLHQEFEPRSGDDRRGRGTRDDDDRRGDDDGTDDRGGDSDDSDDDDDSDDRGGDDDGTDDRGGSGSDDGPGDDNGGSSGDDDGDSGDDHGGDRDGDDDDGSDDHGGDDDGGRGGDDD